MGFALLKFCNSLLLLRIDSYFHLFHLFESKFSRFMEIFNVPCPVFILTLSIFYRFLELLLHASGISGMKGLSLQFGFSIKAINHNFIFSSTFLRYCKQFQRFVQKQMIFPSKLSSRGYLQVFDSIQLSTNSILHRIYPLFQQWL